MKREGVFWGNVPERDWGHEVRKKGRSETERPGSLVIGTGNSPDYALIAALM